MTTPDELEQKLTEALDKNDFRELCVLLSLPERRELLARERRQHWIREALRHYDEDLYDLEQAVELKYGSEKQLAWAYDLRLWWTLAALSDSKHRLRGQEVREQLRDLLLCDYSARGWINRREETWLNVVRDIRAIRRGRGRW